MVGISSNIKNARTIGPTISSNMTTPALCAGTLCNPLNVRIKGIKKTVPTKIIIIIFSSLKTGESINKRGSKKGTAIKFCQKTKETLSYFLNVLDKT